MKFRSVFAGLLLTATIAAAGEAEHRKAAEQLLGIMNIETMLDRSIDNMLKIQMQQNPSLAPFQDTMKSFLQKYMSWPQLKQDMIQIYTEEFNEEEIAELNRFYQTPLGKKTVKKMPVLMAKGAQLGAKRVQEHIGELQTAIAEAAKKVQESKQPPDAPPAPAPK